MKLQDILTIDQDFSVSIDFKAKTDGMYIEIEDAWRGDTETGYGAIVGIDLKKEDIQNVYDFIDNWLKNH